MDRSSLFVEQHQSEFMTSKKKIGGETVIWNYDALLQAKRNAGVSLDTKFSIDLRPAAFKSLSSTTANR